MTIAHFDALTRSLAESHSRRGITRLLGGLGLSATLPALLGLLSPDATAARKKHKKKPCPPCKKRSKGRCKKKLRDGTACRGGTCRGGSCVALAAPSPPPPPGPTCTDRLRNGTETDVDCGGTCPRCPDFQTCASRDDCRGALCTGDVCRVCDPAIANQCGNDALGSCSCQKRNDGQRFCAQAASFVLVNKCPLCPADTHCVETGASSVRCFKLCGTPRFHRKAREAGRAAAPSLLGTQGGRTAGAKVAARRGLF